MSQATLGSTPYQNSSLFSGYYLDERIYDLDDWNCDTEAREAFEDLQTLWDLERDLVNSYNEDELLDAWIDEVLDVLGFGTLSETTLPDSGGYNDRLLFDSDDTRRQAAERKRDGNTEAAYNLSAAILEAKQWDADFTKRFSETRSYRDASHQLKYYLEHTPEDLQWGILTDGRKWRLYGTKDYATEIYYEVDLPELLDSGTLEQFKYFYAFFRPEAFHETAGTSFLDTVWNESETAAQELGEDLQDNVFTALRILGEGFVHTNDLDIDPDDEAARAELKEQSLVLLYRLMFVLYAESRGLIHPDDPAMQDEYEEHFSLNQLRSEIHDDIQSGDTFDDYSGFSTQMWGRLEDLFDLVDEGEESLGIPPYNGGLFDDTQHDFLANHEVADRYIAEVVYRLGTTEGDDGGFVLADYADLDTRHLGSIYEGLLEHEFRIAPEQYAAVSEDGGQVWKPATEVSVADAIETVERGELYVVNDDGERKATGAYYTPDYVVSYIVEETIDPLINDIKADLEADGLEPSEPEYFRRFWQRVKALKILDPAMGSAHFLTSATGYLTEQVMEVVREQEIQGYDEQHLRREIAKECIYGVDINGMAVELGKLSMWLETLAADQPLAFLNHHLKAGNSLVGSDINEVLSDDTDKEDGQLTLMQAADRARRDTLEHVMDLMQELLSIDNETLEDIKSMEEIYDEIRDDPLYQRLFEIANVHTAEQFGLDIPEGVYDEMAGAIENEDDWAEIQQRDWFETAQAIADQESFFHWELEFPEAFFGEDGEKRVDAGFDAIIGNPPYVRQEQLQSVKPYLERVYETYRGVADLYVYFVEKGGQLVRPKGQFGNIISNKFTRADYGEPLREYLQSKKIEQLIDFGSLPVFPNATAYPLILLYQNREETEQTPLIAKIESLDFADLATRIDEQGYTGDNNSLGKSGWSLSTREVTDILNKVESASTTLETYVSGEIYYGIKTGLNDAFFISSEKKHQITSEEGNGEEVIEPLAIGDDIDRYYLHNENRWLILIPSGWTRMQSGIESENKAWKWLKEEYPGIANHLSEYETPAKERHDRGEFWWELRPCDYYDAFTQTKIIYPVIAKGPQFAIDNSGTYLNDKCFLIPSEDYELLGILNSKLTEFWLQSELSGLRGGFQEFRSTHIKRLPVIEDRNKEALSQKSRKIAELRVDREKLNTKLIDYLGTYSNGPKLSNIGLTQSPEGSADFILQQTADQKPNLRVGEATIDRESENTVEIRLTARYKPDDEDAYETDQWGYTETDPLPALRITDLTETEANLIEAFVPVAVNEAGGFANFRETATKTNSLVDRLRKLTLPAVEDVRDGLQSYIETKGRAEELQEKIERTDNLIDEIVYELYGLTDEEIEIVEEAVAE